MLDETFAIFEVAWLVDRVGRLQRYCDKIVTKQRGVSQKLGGLVRKEVPHYSQAVISLSGTGNQVT